MAANKIIIDLHVSTNGRIAVFTNWRLLLSPLTGQRSPNHDRRRLR